MSNMPKEPASSLHKMLLSQGLLALIWKDYEDVYMFSRKLSNFNLVDIDNRKTKIMTISK